MHAWKALLQGEVDQIGVRRAHDRQHGYLPRQSGVLVGVVVPDLLEAHRVLLVPLSPSRSVSDPPRPHGHRRCFLVVAVAAALRDDLDIPQLAAAHRDTSAGVDVGSAVLRELVKEQHRVIDEVDEGVAVAAEEPPREVKPPERRLLGHHAGGNSLPVLRGQGAAQVVPGPHVAACAKAEEPGALGALDNLELGDRVVAVVGGDEADALNFVGDGDAPVAARWDAFAEGRSRVALLDAGRTEVVRQRHDEVGQHRADRGVHAGEGLDAEVEGEAVGPGGENVGVLVGLVGVGMGERTDGEDRDLRRRRDPEEKSASRASASLGMGATRGTRPRIIHGHAADMACFGSSRVKERRRMDLVLPIDLGEFGWQLKLGAMGFSLQKKIPSTHSITLLVGRDMVVWHTPLPAQNANA
uniref:Uncharacterized protein n=1 Tax=Setaria italica TaxID=4555 RepID=K3Y3G0_SETIT